MIREEGSAGHGYCALLPGAVHEHSGNASTLGGLDVAERGMVFHHTALATMNAPLKGSRLQFYCHKRLVRNVVFAAESEPGGR